MKDFFDRSDHSVYYNTKLLTSITPNSIISTKGKMEMELTDSSNVGLINRKNQTEQRDTINSIIESSTSVDVDENGEDAVPSIVHTIDPESCDFEPLTQSFNGAATTDLQSIDLSAAQRYKNYSFNYKYASEGDSSGAEDDDDFDADWDDLDHPSNTSTSIKQLIYSLINSLPLSPQQLEKIQEFRSQMFSTEEHLYQPLQNGSDKDSINEKSKATAVFVCLIFAAIIVICGTLNGIISHLTGSGPEREISISSQSLSNRHNRISRQGQGLAPPLGTDLHPNFEVFADVDDLPLELLDTPVFW